jgi:purine-cytosine permease-like protein
MAENDEVNRSDFADTPYAPTGSRRSTFTPPNGKYPPLFGNPEVAANSEIADAVPGSAELPDRPQRRSLQDDELVRTVTLDIQKPDSTLDAIDRLQAELQLREQEAQEFGEWERRMRTIGTPEALESIAEAIPAFTGVIPIIPVASGSGQLYQPTQSHEEAGATATPVSPLAEGESQETSTTAQNHAEPEPFLHPEQFPPPKLEERVEVGGLQEPNLSNHLVFLPPWMSVSQAESTEDVPSAGNELSAQETTQHEADEHADDASTLGSTVEADTEVQADVDVETPSPVATASELVTLEPPEPPEPPVLYELVDPGAPQPTAQSSSSAPAPSERDGGGVPEADPVAAVDVPAVVEDDQQSSGSAGVPADVATERELLASGGPQPHVTPLPFDTLLVGGVQLDSDVTEASPFSLLSSLPGTESALTGSHEIIIPGLDSEPDDDVDETDRAGGDRVGAFSVTQDGVVLAAPLADSAQIQPVASPRISADERGIDDSEPPRVPLFSFELSSEEATPVERRLGRAARMFWLWFATNSSLVSVAFGAALFGLGMSLRQAILAVFVGVAISFLPLGLGTLAGKWSGQPTIVVSRATFGLVGNIVPAILAVITRVFWGAVLLWLVAVCTARILAGASLGGPFNEVQLSYGAVTVGFALAFLVALFGYSLFARVQLILSVLSGALIVGLFLLTWHEVDFRTALTVADGPWILVVTGVVLVFSFIGLVWANSSGDLARYQRPSGSGASASLWASFGATFPAFLLLAYGALLAASNPGTAKALLTAPLDTMALMIPGWYTVPLLAATILSLLSGVALSLYSGGLALRAVGLRLSRPWGVVVMGAVLLAVTVLMIVSGARVADLFRDLATTLAVPIAAWAGIFAAEVMIRRRRFDEESLLKPGGVYPSVNWVNLTMLVVASVVGFGFTSATVGWLSWQGYGFVLFGFPINGEVAASDLGVLVALLFGLLTPLVAGISTVRQQESASK